MERHPVPRGRVPDLDQVRQMNRLAELVMTASLACVTEQLVMLGD